MADVTFSDVADVLAQRVMTQDGTPAGTFSALTVPTDAQVTRVIAKVNAEETGGLGTIPTPLLPMLNSLVTLSAAVRVLTIYFQADAGRDDLNDALDGLRTRFRQAVDTIATTGDPNVVSADDGGPGDAERPPAAAWSFPVTRPADVLLGGVPVTTLTEQY